MGVVKGVAKHKGKRMVNKAVDEMGVVGDVIDKHTTTGPLDAADDKLDKATDNLDKKKKRVGKKLGS
jgi:hypothetical protein